MSSPPPDADTLRPPGRPPAAPALAPDALDALLASVRADTLDRPATWRDRLVELPTWWRVGLAALLLGAVVGAQALATGLRDDLFGDVAVTTILVTLADLFGLAVLGAAYALASAARPTTPWLPRALAAGLLVAPLAVAMPGVMVGQDVPVPLQVDVHCGVGSLLGAFVGAAAITLLSRHPLGGSRLALAAGAGGLVGLVAGQLHCPVVSPRHLVLGHGLAGVVLLALWTTAQAMSRPASR